MEIVSGINTSCKGLAGVKTLYLLTYKKYNRSQIITDDNILLDFPTSDIYKFDTVGNVNFTEDLNEDDGGKYYDINLSFKTKYFARFKTLINKDVRAVVLDNNGNYRLLGTYNGLTCDNLNKTTGQSKADFNGLEFTFTGKEQRESLFFYDLSVLTELDYLLQENGDYLLQENGFKIEL